MNRINNRNLSGLSANFVFLVCTLVLFACGDRGTIDETPEILSRGLNGDPETLDPQKFSSSQAGDVLRDIGEGLLSISPTGELIAGVAEFWRTSPDGLTYTFELRKDARWSNGEEVQASDFVRAFRRMFEPQTASNHAGKLTAIENARSILSGESESSVLAVRELDERTLEIKLEQPTPYFLSLITHPSTFPLHRSGADKKLDQVAFRPQHYISNGAYTLASRVLGSEIVLERNSFYWDDENTYFDVVRYHVVDPAREVVRFLAGDIDITSNVDGDSFESLKNTHAMELKVSPYLGTYYYGINLTRDPYKANVRLREALSLSIDRQAIVSSVTKRGEVPAYGLVPTGVSDYRAAQPLYSQMTQTDREYRAKEAYAQAGYSLEKPLTFELRYNTGGGHENIALAVKSMWENVLGAEVKLVKEEFGVFIENVKSMAETEIFRLSWTGDYNDAQTFLQLFESDNPNNLTGYSNKEVDALLRKGAHETDKEERRTLLQDAEKLALSEFPLIPIYFFVSKHLVRSHICGWQPNLLDYHFSKGLRRCEE